MKLNKHNHFSKKQELSKRDIQRLNDEVFSKKMDFHRKDAERLEQLEKNKPKGDKNE